MNSARLISNYTDNQNFVYSFGDSQMLGIDWTYKQNKSHDLERIFTIKNERCLSKNLTLQYKNTLYQIVSDRQSYTLRHAQVTVSENDVGNVRIFYKDKELKYTIHDFQEKQGIIVDSKHLNQEVDSIIKQPRNIPAKCHPLRKTSRRRPVFIQ